MKTVKELKSALRLRPTEIASTIKYFKKMNIDFDVFLPTKGEYLQRPNVWTTHQRRELIWSMLYGRHIPHMSMIHNYNEVYEVIDGKQRLSAMLDFVNDKFTLLIDGEEYLFSQLPEDYQLEINHYSFRYYVVEQYKINDVSDDDRIIWFRYINFAGTEQDEEHMKILSNLIK
jgi:hypothetical protein